MACGARRTGPLPVYARDAVCWQDHDRTSRTHAQQLGADRWTEGAKQQLVSTLAHRRWRTARPARNSNQLPGLHLTPSHWFARVLHRERHRRPRRIIPFSAFMIVGFELAEPGRTSRTITVPAAVPLVCQSSKPFVPLLATKYNLPFAGCN